MAGALLVGQIVPAFSINSLWCYLAHFLSISFFFFHHIVDYRTPGLLIQLYERFCISSPSTQKFSLMWLNFLAVSDELPCNHLHA